MANFVHLCFSWSWLLFMLLELHNAIREKPNRKLLIVIKHGKFGNVIKVRSHHQIWRRFSQKLPLIGPKKVVASFRTGSNVGLIFAVLFWLPQRALEWRPFTLFQKMRLPQVVAFWTKMPLGMFMHFLHH